VVQAQEGGGHQDGRERVVEVVRDAAGELSDGFQSLRSVELPLGGQTIGDIKAMADVTDVVTTDVVPGRGEDLDGAVFAIVTPDTIKEGEAFASDDEGIGFAVDALTVVGMDSSQPEPRSCSLVRPVNCSQTLLR